MAVAWSKQAYGCAPRYPYFQITARPEQSRAERWPIAGLLAGHPFFAAAVIFRSRDHADRPIPEIALVRDKKLRDILRRATGVRGVEIVADENGVLRQYIPIGRTAGNAVNLRRMRHARRSNLDLLEFHGVFDQIGAGKKSSDCFFNSRLRRASRCCR